MGERVERVVMTVEITDSELANLITEAGHRHHTAYEEAQGVDPEWPLFHAAYLHTRIWDRLDVILTRSEIIHVLVEAGVETGDWPSVYARRLREFATAKSSRA